MSIATVMQPYFMPYAGYFRLFAVVDTFVVFDDVQFPRRGRVHRNQLLRADGSVDWLTLPLRKAPRNVSIANLAFTDDAEERFIEQCRRFPALANPEPAGAALFDRASRLEPDPVTYLMDTLKEACDQLGLPCTMVRASTLGLDPALRSGARVRAAAHAVGASIYANSPGGRELYDAYEFAEDGLKLLFLPPWEGPYISILQALSVHQSKGIADTIRGQAQLEP